MILHGLNIIRTKSSCFQGAFWSQSPKALLAFDPCGSGDKHLKQLREAGLVEAEKRGRFVYYKVKTPVSSFVQGIAQAVNAIDPESFKEDKKRCKEICCCFSDEQEKWFQILIGLDSFRNLHIFFSNWSFYFLRSVS
mgnify:CR=1 FL=1